MPSQTAPRRTTRTLATGIVWVALYFGARGLLEHTGGSSLLRVAIAIAPIPAFCAFLWQVIQGIRSADEFERRMHLEALAIAYPLAMLLLMTLALLQRAIDLKFEDWSYAHVWYYLPLFYCAGLMVARKRYA